jgi:hypothetical protein
MFKTIQNSEVNLLFFENNNIEPKAYFYQINGIKNKNNIKINKPSESLDDKINSSQNLLSLSKESSNSFSFSESEENTNEIKESKICEEFIFPLPGFDIFDYSKCIQISIQDDDDDEFYYEKNKKEKKSKIDYNVDNDNKSTGPSEPNQNKIELIKKAKIDKNERKRTNNYLGYNKNIKNRKSPSPTKRIRERSRTKNNWF